MGRYEHGKQAELARQAAEVLDEIGPVVYLAGSAVNYAFGKDDALERDVFNLSGLEYESQRSRLARALAERGVEVIGYDERQDVWSIRKAAA